MFIIRGVNVFPSQVESALLAVEGTLPHYQIILTREEGLDQMEVHVEVTPAVSSDKVGALENLHNKLAQSLYQTHRTASGGPAGGAADPQAQRGKGATAHRSKKSVVDAVSRLAELDVCASTPHPAVRIPRSSEMVPRQQFPYCGRSWRAERRGQDAQVAARLGRPRYDRGADRRSSS